MTIVTSSEPRVAVGRPHRPGSLAAGAAALGVVLAGALGALLALRPAEVAPEAASAPISASVPAALSLDLAPRAHDDWAVAPRAARPRLAPGIPEPPDRRSDNRFAPNGDR